LKQVWFPGADSDVGGGYPEEQSGASKVALHWMLCEARKAGLLFDDERVATIMGERGGGYVKPDLAAM
jgi:Uncharacterized alpha/beta hydrolase domain (DUF2235)